MLSKTFRPVVEPSEGLLRLIRSSRDLRRSRPKTSHFPFAGKVPCRSPESHGRLHRVVIFLTGRRGRSAAREGQSRAGARRATASLTGSSSEPARPFLGAPEPRQGTTRTFRRGRSTRY